MTVKVRCCVFVLLLVLIAGLSTSCAPGEAEKEALRDPLEIDTGYISGTVIGDVENEVRIYRGIPYAAPPVGDLRWKRPQPPDSWQGIRVRQILPPAGSACRFSRYAAE